MPLTETQTAESAVLIPRFGRHGPRSKTGCSTCRIRKVKCDERKASCLRCTQAKVKCEWGLPPKPRKRSGTDVTLNSLSFNSTTLIKAGTPSHIVDDHFSSFDFETDFDRHNFIEESSIDEDFDFSSFDQSLSFSWLLQSPQPSPRLPLSVNHIPLANSLQIGSQEWDAFQYFPKSMIVLALGKPWRWSMLSYIHSTVAKQEPGVMRCFIAIGFMELCAQEVATNSSTTDTSTRTGRAEQLRRLAMRHYQQAIKDLSAIYVRASQPTRTATDLDSLFAMWLLILSFESYGAELVENAYTHLSGIRAFIHLALEQSEKLELPPASMQLLHFICHLDSNFALSNGRGGQLNLDLMQLPTSSGVNRDQLFEHGRTCLPVIWGADYPEDEIIDDFENYRGLSLLHTATKLKLSVWKVGVAIRNATIDYESVKRLWDKIESVKNEFRDVLTLSQLAKPFSGRRVVFTVYHAALEYYAVRLLFTCLPPPPSTPPTATGESPSSSQDQTFPWLSSTLSDLLKVAYKALGENPALSHRYAGPLCIALLKTTDPIHRDWLRGHIQKAGILLANMGVPRQLLLENTPGAGDNSSSSSSSLSTQVDVMNRCLFIES